MATSVCRSGGQRPRSAGPWPRSARLRGARACERPRRTSIIVCDCSLTWPSMKATRSSSVDTSPPPQLISGTNCAQAKQGQGTSRTVAEHEGIGGWRYSRSQIVLDSRTPHDGSSGGRYPGERPGRKRPCRTRSFTKVLRQDLQLVHDTVDFALFRERDRLVTRGNLEQAARQGQLLIVGRRLRDTRGRRRSRRCRRTAGCWSWPGRRRRRPDPARAAPAR